MTILLSLTEEEFDVRFPLVENHLNPQATWAFGDGRGCLFETYGEEFEFVRQQDPARIWTLVDSDDGDCYVVSGLHFVNRVGYLISRDPVPSGTVIEAHIPMSIDESDASGKGQP
jgi:hypothetical protein